MISVEDTTSIREKIKNRYYNRRIKYIYYTDNVLPLRIPTALVWYYTVNKLKEVDMRVLVVDDSKTMLRINSQIVTSLGYEVVTAVDGLDALEKLAKVSLILLDINMPNLDGFGFLEKTKEHRKSNGIATIMCTTEGGRDEVIKALRLGANSYIVKPINRDVLIEKIKDVLCS